MNSLFIGASNQLGEFESGLIAGWFGIVPSGVIGGAGRHDSGGRALDEVLSWSAQARQIAGSGGRERDREPVMKDELCGKHGRMGFCLIGKSVNAGI